MSKAAHSGRKPGQPVPVGPEGEPRQPLIDLLKAPLVRFLHVQAASGVVLLVCTVAALLLANSTLALPFASIWETRLGLTLGGFELEKPLFLWINDGLMTVFFFVMGLEIKRELVLGELRDRRKAALPAAAALGGMIVPAAIYLAMQGGGPAQSGWGIPMATDIAFVVGFLALLGSRVPYGLKILLLSLAIVDDIGAVLVIALFYTGDISTSALGVAAAGFVLLALLNLAGVRRVAVYAVLGAGIWLAVLKSGVHPTVAGVLLGLLTPASAWFGDRTLREAVALALPRRAVAGARAGTAGDVAAGSDGAADDADDDADGDSPRGELDSKALLRVADTARETVSPLERLETSLHPWVAFAIMPVFALANAGVTIDPSGLGSPVAMAVAAGLFLGKPIGILLFSALAVRLGLARLPDGVSWKVVLGAGFLAGIGFTMSLFIAGLALDGDTLTAGKVGTLTGSALSAIVGMALLLRFLRPAARAPAAP